MSMLSRSLQILGSNLWDLPVLQYRAQGDRLHSACTMTTTIPKTKATTKVHNCDDDAGTITATATGAATAALEEYYTHNRAHHHYPPPVQRPKAAQWPRAECSWPGSRTRPPCRRSLPAARAATRCRTRRRSLKPDPRTRGSLIKAEGPRLECSGGGKRLATALSRTFHFCLLASLLPATCSGMRVLRAAPWMLCCGDGLIISSSASIVFIAPDTDT